jgi:hypothetical protein
MAEVSSIKEFIKDIEGFRDRDIPYIARMTADNVGFKVKDILSNKIPAKLNINRKSLLTPIRVKRGSKSSPFTTVYVKEDSWQYDVLKHHYTGGDRERKGMEKLFIRVGIMTENMILTPSPGVKIRGTVYNEIISQLKIRGSSGYDTKETKKSRLRKERRKNKRRERFFLVLPDSHITQNRTKHLSPGVYARVGGHDAPVMLLRISNKPKYKKTFKNFEQTVNDLSNQQYKESLASAMERVLKKNKDMGWT